MEKTGRSHLLSITKPPKAWPIHRLPFRQQRYFSAAPIGTHIHASTGEERGYSVTEEPNGGREGGIEEGVGREPCKEVLLSECLNFRACGTGRKKEKYFL